MKKLVLMVVLAVSGCAQQDRDTDQVPWDKSTAQETIAGATVRMTANLWLNKMPSINGEQRRLLRGALYLEGREDLPADLDASALIIKQGDLVQWVALENIDVRNHSGNRWEVAFYTDMSVNGTDNVDVGLQLTDTENTYWLIQEQVKVGSVY
ncbi:hypothetical protein HC752_18425 [Vibrio sp. S9_S30]|uniref:hypothetical protein n=1 Tax=Vibrio sp. S9_S30 TaxID=2720226 RepID=UPI0016810531|nr:hypothetical protein [Vibrio sp. S9_S30]MBD1558914.1 hypothetical protein [Vibrio sp. S9_S30]